MHILNGIYWQTGQVSKLAKLHRVIFLSVLHAHIETVLQTYEVLIN